MTWEEKIQALQAIAECTLRMRKPGNWYVSFNAGIGGDGFIRGDYGNGKNPEEAVIAHWDIFTTNLPSDRYIIVNGNYKGEKRVRWNGFMWEDIPFVPPR